MLTTTRGHSHCEITSLTHSYPCTHPDERVHKNENSSYSGQHKRVTLVLLAQFCVHVALFFVSVNFSGNSGLRFGWFARIMDRRSPPSIAWHTNWTVACYLNVRFVYDCGHFQCQISCVVRIPNETSIQIAVSEFLNEWIFQLLLPTRNRSANA